MPRRLAVLAAMWGAAAMVALTACTDGAAAPGAQVAQAQESKAGRVYVIAPQTGDDAALGLGTARSVELAFSQAAQRGDLPGWKIEVQTIDDKGDKAAAAQAAQKAAGDEQTVAVIGSIYSGLTAATLDTLTSAGIPQVSPSASNPTLSKGDDYVKKPKRSHPNFFRIIPPDDAHAPALSKYLRGSGVARVAIVHDGDSYGSGLAKAFSSSFTADGGRIISVDTVDPEKPAEYSKLAAKLAESKPQAVMFGGNEPQGGPLSQQLKKAGLIVPVVGGDAIGTEMYIIRAGALAGGDVSTAGGKPLADVPQGRQYLADYRAVGIADSPTSYGPLAYDAANAVIAALKTSLPQSGSPKESRAATIKALGRVSFDGTTSKVAFDEFGDITPRVVTVMTLKGGQWTPAQTYDLG